MLSQIAFHSDIALSSISRLFGYVSEASYNKAIIRERQVSSEVHVESF